MQADLVPYEKMNQLEYVEVLCDLGREELQLCQLKSEPVPSNRCGVLIDLHWQRAPLYGFQELLSHVRPPEHVD